MYVPTELIRKFRAPSEFTKENHSPPKEYRLPYSHYRDRILIPMQHVAIAGIVPPWDWYRAWSQWLLPLALILTTWITLHQVILKESPQHRALQHLSRRYDLSSQGQRYGHWSTIFPSVSAEFDSVQTQVCSGICGALQRYIHAKDLSAVTTHLRYWVMSLVVSYAIENEWITCLK